LNTVSISFKFVEIQYLPDLAFLYTFLLIISVIVSMISATYYFKVYELMYAKQNEKLGDVVLTVHDSSSILATLILVVALFG